MTFDYNIKYFDSLKLELINISTPSYLVYFPPKYIKIFCHQYTL